MPIDAPEGQDMDLDGHGPVRQLLEQSQWSRGIDPARDGPINWRHHASGLLCKVSVAAVLAELAPLLSYLEQISGDEAKAREAERLDREQPFAFVDWLPCWTEHFTHWLCPVRALLNAHCTSPDAEWFAELMPAMDGLVLFDFVLSTARAFERQQRFKASLADKCYETALPGLEPPHARPGERALISLTRHVYIRFAAEAPFSTEAPPSAIDLRVDYDRLFPVAQNRSSSPEGGTI